MGIAERGEDGGHPAGEVEVRHRLFPEGLIRETYGVASQSASMSERVTSYPASAASVGM